jgi:hypothetical protein
MPSTAWRRRVGWHAYASSGSCVTHVRTCAADDWHTVGLAGGRAALARVLDVQPTGSEARAQAQQARDSLGVAASEHEPIDAMTL